MYIQKHLYCIVVSLSFDSTHQSIFNPIFHKLSKMSNGNSTSMKYDEDPAYFDSQVPNREREPLGLKLLLILEKVEVYCFKMSVVPT